MNLIFDLSVFVYTIIVLIVLAGMIFFIKKARSRCRRSTKGPILPEIIKIKSEDGNFDLTLILTGDFKYIVRYNPCQGEKNKEV